MATHSSFLPGESHGQRSLVGYSPQGRKESDATEGTWHTFNISIYFSRRFIPEDWIQFPVLHSRTLFSASFQRCVMTVSVLPPVNALRLLIALWIVHAAFSAHSSSALQWPYMSWQSKSSLFPVVTVPVVPFSPVSCVGKFTAFGPRGANRSIPRSW